LRRDPPRLVLLGRIELPTSPLPRVRSTTELQQPLGLAAKGALLVPLPIKVKLETLLT
jgi:hypothetical protein